MLQSIFLIQHQEPFFDKIISQHQKMPHYKERFDVMITEEETTTTLKIICKEKEYINHHLPSDPLRVAL
jgi:hypothetical protein